LCFAGKDPCSRLTKKNLAYSLKKNLKGFTVEKHCKILKCTVKVKRNTMKVT